MATAHGKLQTHGKGGAGIKKYREQLAKEAAARK
jgi:hypothetical protein